MRPMNSAPRFPRCWPLGGWRFLAVAFACIQAASIALAQSDDCESLRQQMASGADPARAAQYQRAAQRQRSELARTRSYADQIGCGGALAILTDALSGQCDTIDAQIRRMENNLSLLESQLSSAQGGASDETSVAARYNTYCRTSDSTPSDPLGWDSLRPDVNDENPDAGPDEGAPRRSGGKVICVRTCDGGFFPLGRAGASAGGVERLQSLCSALCPNTEAKLYTTPEADDLNAAVAADGTPYSSLPSAFQFQTTFDAACTCKPPNKTWVEALAQAETLLDKGDKDVTVTSTMSDAMARPVAATPVPSRKKADRKTRVDLQAAENALATQAPTASTDSAGIASGAGSTEHVVKTGEGAIKEVSGPDGAKRRVRIIEPPL